MAISIAAAIGRFIGGILAECGPVLVEIIRDAIRPTAEDGKAPDDLRKRLLDRINRVLPDTDKDDIHPAGGSGTPPRNP